MRIACLLTGLALLAGCIEDPVEQEPAFDAPERAIDDLSEDDYIELCVAAERTALGSILRTCDAAAALATVLEFEPGQSCEDLRDTCLNDFEADLRERCVEDATFSRRRCDEPASAWLACAEARATAISGAIGRFRCDTVGDLTQDDVRALQDALETPAACDAFEAACPPFDEFEPDPVTPPVPQPEPVEPVDPPEPSDVVYDTVLIFDVGSENDGAGTSGVDLCGISADCASAVSAAVVLGGGELCREEGPGCSTDRTAPQTILDDGSQCEIDSVPSDYVSLGTDGSIAVEFDGDLSGCTLTIVEFAGATEEAWSAYVCDSDDVTTANCVAGGSPVHEAPAGGEATFAVPAE
jgi:hypothetical protein